MHKKRRNSKGKKKKKRPKPPDLAPAGSDEKLFQPTACIIRAEDLVPSPHDQKRELLGEGAYSIVYAAVYKGRSVAVKVYKVDSSALDSAPKDIYNEYAIMTLSQKHVNIVEVIGRGDFKEPYFVVMERATCSLYSALKRKKKRRLSQKCRLYIAFCIAKALEHLHLLKPAIIHRDLKSPNIMLRDDGTPFLIDFGLSKQLKNKSIGTKLIGTHRWMAPEMSDDDIETSEAIDIYSYGMVLYELVKKKKPFYQEKKEGEVNKLVCMGERPKTPTIRGDLEILIDLMIGCWNHVPKNRSSLSDVLRCLEMSIAPLACIPLPPFFLYIILEYMQFPRVIRGHELKFAPNEDEKNLKDCLTVAEDRYGAVFQTNLRTMGDVSFRRFSKSGSWKSTSKETLAVDLVQQTNSFTFWENQNLMQIFGFCVTDQNVCFVMECGWNLRERIGEISCEMKLQIAKGIALGLKRLHQNNEICWLPLETRDIWIRSSSQLDTLKDLRDSVMLSFAYHRILPRELYQKYGDDREIVRWQAPEALEEGKETKASNVFSYGSVLFELLTSKPPWSEIKTEDVSSYLLDGKVPSFGNRAYEPKEDALIDLVKSCWEIEPEKRPTFDKILEKLESLH